MNFQTHFLVDLMKQGYDEGTESRVLDAIGISEDFYQQCKFAYDAYHSYNKVLVLQK